MTGTAGDAHIWLPTTGDQRLAACGYTPPLVDITAVGRDEEDVVVGQQVKHAKPTGKACAKCLGVDQPEDEPAPEAATKRKARSKA